MMSNMEKITYIVPVHVFNEDVKPFVEKALKSVTILEGAEQSEIFLTGELEVITQVQKLFNDVCGEDNKQIVTLVPTNEKDLFKKINFAVSKCKTQYFSILEFDDEYYPYWNKVAQRYVAKGYSVIVPISEIQTPEGQIAGLANEIAWDAAFVGEERLGVITVEDLLVFKDILTSGAYIKTEDFNELGGLKPELKLAAWYEYLLHTANENKVVFVTPRIGYRHTALRKDSYMSNIANEITKEEGIALIQEAMKPYQKEENKE